MSSKVIYHGGCSDGFCAAWVASKFLGIGEESLIRAQYGYDVPEGIEAGDTVYIVDFSYPQAQLRELCNRVADGKVILLDHHKSAQKELEGFKLANLEIVFDMERSGARITFEYFLERQHEFDPVHSDVIKRMETISRYVQDRDLWHWKLECSREVSAYLAAVPKTLTAWDRFEDMDILEIIRLGSAIQMSLEAQVETMTRKSKYQLCDDRLDKVGEDHLCIPIINICVAAPGSEILNELAIGRHMAIGWAQNGDGSYYYSLRSDKDGIDVGAFAQRMRDSGMAFAGGGHEHAGGFSSALAPGALFTNFRPAKEES